MGLSFGGMWTTAGEIAGREQDNRFRAQQMAGTRINQAERLRQIRNDEAARAGGVATLPPFANPVPRIKTPQVGSASISTPRVTAPPVGGAQPTPAPRVTAPPVGTQPPAGPTSKLNMNMPGVNPAPVAFNAAETNANMAGGRYTTGFGAQAQPTLAQTPRQPVVQNSGGLIPSANAAPPAVQNTGAQPPQQVSPVGNVAPATAPQVRAVASPPAAINQKWSADTSPDRQKAVEMDAIIQQMEATYQQALPYARDPATAQYLRGLQGQIIQASLARNQSVINDSFTELASSGDPTRVTQILNGIGYSIGFSRDTNGKLTLTTGGKNPKKVVSGLPHEIATYLRIQFNAEFQKERMKAINAERLEHIKGRYSNRDKTITGMASIQSSRGRNAEAAYIAAGKPQLKPDGFGGMFFTHNGQVYKFKAPPEQEIRGQNGMGSYQPAPYFEPLGTSPTDMGEIEPYSDEFNTLFGITPDTKWPPQ